MLQASQFRLDILNSQMLCLGVTTHYSVNPTNTRYSLFFRSIRTTKSHLYWLCAFCFFLEAVALTERNIEDKHVSVQSIIDYFDVLGCSEAACLSVLNKLFVARLIEPYDVSVPNVAAGQKLAITFAGKAHVQLATTNRAFFSQMALTTSITDESKADEISQVYLSKNSPRDRHDTIRKVFADYLLIEDAQHLQHTTSSPAYQGQSELIGLIKRLGTADNKSQDKCSRHHIDFKEKRRRSSRLV